MYIDFYKIWRYIINICLVLLVLIFLHDCNHSSTPTENNNNITPNFYSLETADYSIKYNEILDKPIEKIYNVNGFFINKTKNTYSAVNLSFSIWDNQERIGTAKVVIYNVEPNKRYNFTAQTLGITSVDVTNATAVLIEINISF